MIFSDTSPYGEILDEDFNSEFSKDDEGIDIVLPVAHAETHNEEPSKDSVSYHIENRKEILKTQLEEKIRNQSMMNLLSFGIVAGVGVLLVKRFWK